tara:strand:- start:148 stop:324 length:177 start_codon:yes stop_codon:yes gene_type:complete
MKDLIRRLEDWEKSVENEEREEKKHRVWYLIERAGIVAIIIAATFLIHAVTKIWSLSQ